MTTRASLVQRLQEAADALDDGLPLNLAPLLRDAAAALAGQEELEESNCEHRSPDGDGHEKGTVVGTETSAPERPTAGTSRGTDLKGCAGKPRASELPMSATSTESPVVEALGRAAGSEPADAQTLIDRLENYYDFECTGGPLRNCKEWQELKAALACVSGTCGDCRECLHKTIIRLEKDLADAKRFIKRYQDIV